MSDQKEKPEPKKPIPEVVPDNTPEAPAPSSDPEYTPSSDPAQPSEVPTTPPTDPEFLKFYGASFSSGLATFGKRTLSIFSFSSAGSKFFTIKSSAPLTFACMMALISFSALTIMTGTF